MKLNIKNINVYLPVIIALVLVAGIFIGLQFDRGNNNDDRVFIYPRPNNKISNVINYIEEEYVDSVSVNKLVESAIPAILDELDPHSVYIPAKKLKKVNEPLKGNFEGIGIEFNMPNDTVIVINTISGGPSQKVGMLPGDRIIEIEDSVVAGKDMPTSEIVKQLKGPKGTIVEVGVKRRGVEEILHFEITRDEIPLYSVDVSYMVNDSSGYIKIARFARTTHDEFRQALDKLNKQGMNQIIIDLRGNGGGYMDAATDIANEFLEDGKLIVYTEGRARPKNEIYANEKGLSLDHKVIILIDEFSASASEILAGAIQDNDRGLIVGRRSFGKGLVQQQTVFPDKSALRLTVARYYTPTGRCIQKPYENGDQSSYYDDLNKRYKHGEFQERDSIDFADSLIYTTPEGDTVYGGGGIMPDVFVPFDTTNYSDYYQQVSRKGLIYKYAFQYADTHREILKPFTMPEEFRDYLTQQNLLEQFYRYASENGVSQNNEGIRQSKELLRTQLIAYVARNIIGEEGFYPILHQTDKTFQKAVDVMGKSSRALK